MLTVVYAITPPFIQEIFLLNIWHVLNSGDTETIRKNTAPALIELRTGEKRNQEIITHLIDSLQLWHV